ncbi:MAG: hypothetical protein ACI9IV_002084 [Paracoccaceae bacterium]|jgi:hypothetical protein
MKIKMTLAAIILGAMPSLAMAACSGYGHSEQANISCAEGTVFDASLGQCIDQASS